MTHSSGYLHAYTPYANSLSTAHTLGSGVGTACMCMQRVGDWSWQFACKKDNYEHTQCCGGVAVLVHARPVRWRCLSGANVCGVFAQVVACTPTSHPPAPDYAHPL